MKNRIIIFVISLMTLAILYGCCSHSSDAVFVNPQSDEVITSKEIVIDELGRLPTVSFPSGAKIEGLEENTLTPGIIVTIIERKVTAQNASNFTNSSNADVYIYKISAVKNPATPIEAKTYVTTTEKPIKVALPFANDSQGITLAGIKESDTDPWRLFNYTDSSEALPVNADERASVTLPKNNSFNIFRLGIQFALVVYEGNTGNRLPESYVSWLNASSTASILVKEGKFIEDLTIIGILKGFNLNSLKPSDLRARITYRNNKADEAPIKVNGINVTQTSRADKTVPGYTYYHSFLVDSLSESNLIGTQGKFTFTLNLSRVETQSFSSGFLIEFFNNVDSEKILPYNYTEFYSVNKIGVYDIVYELNGGSVEEPNPTTYSEDTETFILNEPAKEGYTFIGWSGTGLDTASMTLSIPQGSTGNRTYTANWSSVAYAITYVLNGGALTEANPEGYNFASETFVLNEPTKEGYTFIGWTGSNGDTPQKPLYITQGSTSDLNFVANWATNSYMLTLSKGTGINTVTGDGIYEYNSAVTATCTMLDGYEFASWSGDLTTDTFNMPASNATMTANAKPIVYNIVYNLDNGQMTADNPVYYDITSATITLNNPTKLGYTFIGWSGSNGNEPQTTVTIANGSIGNKEFTANYTPISYSIVYTLNDGILATQNPTSYDITSATISINNPTKEGYSFAGWTGTGLDAASMTLSIPRGSTENRNYVANWSINSYRLDLVKGQGISTITGDGLYEFNSTVTASCTMLNGYEFASWSGDLTTETFNMPASNATMTANAKPIAYTITYNLNGGSETIPNPTSYDVTSATITLNKPTKIGNVDTGFYIFAGWTNPDLDVASLTLTIPQNSTGNREYTANWIILEMKPIPAGTFTMGSSNTEKGFVGPEAPKHQVTISKSFYMGKYEVTQDQFFGIMEINPSGHKEGGSSYERPITTASYPVENINWNTIASGPNSFIAKINTQLANQIPAGYRFDLPTEAQWEYACRAGTTTGLNSGLNITQDWGTPCPNLDPLAWYSNNANGQTHTVGLKQPNAWGLYDMHGNIWEWCRDWTGDYSSAAVTDPTGPTSGPGRVGRGGSWVAIPSRCRSAFRGYGDPAGEDMYGSTNGFRLALVPDGL